MSLRILLCQEDMTMANIHLSNPVTDLYGIGPAAEEKLAKLDIYTIYDLIAFVY